MTLRTHGPDALVIPPGTTVPGRARPAAPLRREGPEKLTGTALYTDDIVVPGAWYGTTIRSSDAHATFDALELDPAFDWSKVIVVTADDIPGDNVVSSIKSDQPILVPVGGEIQHHAEPLALIAAPDRATLREARHRARAADLEAGPGVRPRRLRSRVRDIPHRQRRPRRRDGRRRPRPRGRVPRRTPGTAVHREQRDDRRPDRGRRRHRHGLAPVPVLPAHRAQARARPR